MLQIFLLLAFVIPAIFFVLAQQKTLQVISPENRAMSPESVWLQLIPFFGMVWQFLVVVRIANSISKEMASKIVDSILDDSQAQIKETEESPTFAVGIAYCILTTLGVIINYYTMQSASYLALVGSLFAFTGMVCWIIYWVRLVKTKNKLAGFSVGFAS